MSSGAGSAQVAAAESLFHERQRQQRGMAFVHMEQDVLAQALRPQQPHAAHAQHNLLEEPVALVAAV